MNCMIFTKIFSGVSRGTTPLEPLCEKCRKCLIFKYKQIYFAIFWIPVLTLEIASSQCFAVASVLPSSIHILCVSCRPTIADKVTLALHGSFLHRDFSNYSGTWPRSNASLKERKPFATHITGKWLTEIKLSGVWILLKRPMSVHTTAQRNFSHKEH